MKRDIIEINQELCIGCRQCVDTCHQGALALIDGKATLVSEEYCDGLGRCLPDCPTGALTIVTKEREQADPVTKEPLACGCPGSMVQEIKKANPTPLPQGTAQDMATPVAAPVSQLTNWPVQLGLVPTRAPYFAEAHLLIAADCTAFSYGDFHSEFLQNRICLIGCPKLDSQSYTEKLTEIFRENTIASVTILRMEVPCCGGLVTQVTEALAACGKMIPWGFHIISLEGELLPQ